jgi:hypothetical protein
VTQAHNIWVTENAVIHVEQLEKSAINIDQAAGSMWMMEFSVILMLRACVTRHTFLTVTQGRETYLEALYRQIGCRQPDVY